MKSSEEFLKALGPVVRFGPFRLDTRRRTLEREGAPLPLSPRTFDALALLVERREDLLSKQVLLETLWPDVIVEENSLARVISDLRKALGDYARVIVTVPRRGYRFDGTVQAETRADSPVANVPILAILPFGSGDDDADRLFAFGLADALAVRLSRVRGLIVRPSHSVAPYQGLADPAAQAGKALGADILASGSIRRQGDRTRASIQLIDAASQTTLWADQVEDSGLNAFELEDAIADRLADALAITIRGSERPNRRSGDPRAYELFLQSRALIAQRTRRSLQRAGDLLREAIDRDPDFALGHAALAEALTLSSLTSVTLEAPLPATLIPEAKQAAERALALDPDLPEALAVKGHVAISYDWNFAEAERALRRSLQIAPTNANTHNYFAIALSAVRRYVEAVDEIRLARELDPTSTTIHANVGTVLYWAGRWEEACSQLTAVVALDPRSTYARFRLGLALDAAGRLNEARDCFEQLVDMDGAAMHGHVGLGHVLGRQGLTDGARAELECLKDLSGRQYVPSCYLAEIHCALSENDLAIESLERAVVERPVMMISLLNNPKLAPLAGHPGFERIVRLVGLC